jgi:hypothetical protein
LSDPHRYDQPARLSEYYHTDSDHGGVHTNSGIVNHAFYLLAEGLNGAVGLRDAEKIFYRALAHHLVANSRFVDARLACIASAEELFGRNSRQALKTAEAFDAVEIYDGRGTPQPTPFPAVTGVDATLFMFWDDIAEAYYLGRREEGFDDPSDGVQLVDPPLAAARPSVSGDGTLAVFVSADNDVCFVSTDGTAMQEDAAAIERCLGLPGLVGSVAMDPAAERFGFVLLDEDGDPDDVITVIELIGEARTRTFELLTPTDAEYVDSVLYADSLDFTADGRLVVYDALNELRLASGSTVERWSIYALDLERERIFSIVPADPDFDFGFPSLSQTSDGFLTFDAYNREEEASRVMAGNLVTGEFKRIATVPGGWGVPGYTGDDTALVYSQASDTPTEFSLLRQALNGDRMTPRGQPTPWLENADYGTIYRRGSFVGPGQCAGDCNSDAAVTVDEVVRAVNIALGGAVLDDCAAADDGQDGTVTVDELVRAVAAALSGC